MGSVTAEIFLIWTNKTKSTPSLTRLRLEFDKKINFIQKITSKQTYEHKIGANIFLN